MLVQEKLLRVIEYGELERRRQFQPLQVNASGWCAPPTLTCRRWSRKVIFALTCSTAWPSTWYSSRYATGRATSCCLPTKLAIQMCRELGSPLFPRLFSERATATLLGYRWPGNTAN